MLIAAKGENAAQMAGEIGDGLINTSPDTDVIEAFEKGGGKDKMRYGKLTICWATSEEEAKQTVHKIWPNGGLSGSLSQELRTVVHLEQAAEMVTEAMATESILCGPDPEPILKRISEYRVAGYNNVYLHQIGPDQDGFFKFCEKEILPRQ